MTLKLCQLIEYYVRIFFSWKNHAEIIHQNPVQESFLTLVNNPKQPLHTRNCFKNKVFGKRIIRKPEKC